MLEEIRVKNLALLEDVHVELERGLNVITGETGAGKSLFVTSIALLMGSRNDQGLIRSGQDSAEVSCVLTRRPGNPELERWMEANGFSDEEGRLILRRILREGKRDQIYINGTPASRQQLEELTGFLIDLHGQNEHQSLSRTDVQRQVLDTFGGLTDYVAQFQKEHQALTQLNAEIQERQRLMQRRDEEVQRLTRIIDDIEKANLQVGEEEELKSEKVRLEKFEQVATALQHLKESLWDGRGSALGLLRGAQAQAAVLSAIDPSLKGLEERLESAWIELNDVADTYRHMLATLSFDENRLREVEERLSTIYSLEKKYGHDIPAVLVTLENARRELEMATSAQESLEELRSRAAQMEKILLKKAQELTNRRQQAARQFEAQVAGVLAELHMAGARFEVRVEPRVSEQGTALIGPNGMDRVEFYLAANTGEPLKPLRQTASGGELSRMMLAIKSVLNDTDNMSVLVFDEIDTGIGGEVGLALGRYLQKLGARKQVLCVTHLASIAAHARAQFFISKHEAGGRTVTTVRRLRGEERVREIARLLSGTPASALSSEHAREMLDLYSPGED